MRVSGLQLVTIDKRKGELVLSEQPWSEFDDSMVDGTLEHLREWHRHDPHMAHAATLPVGSIMNTAESFPLSRYEDHPFYREYWTPYGGKALMAAKCAEDDRHLTMIGLSRVHPLPFFTADDIRVLERYVGHLVRAFRIARHLAIQQVEAMTGRSLLMASRRPMALLESGGRLAVTNPAAQTLFSRGYPLYVADERLRCRRLQDQAAMTRCLEEINIDDKAVQVERPRRLALKLGADRPESERLLCSVWCMRPESTMGAFGTRPVALLTIATRTAASGVDPVFLASMFDLTPAECRLSTSLLDGKSLRAIAHTYGVALDTLKGQLKSVFLKTGTHRQAELVAMMLRVASE